MIGPDYEPLHNTDSIRLDETLFRKLFDVHWFDLYEIAYKKLRSHDDAEEVVQRVFVDLWTKRDTLVITDLERYLKVCTSHKCIDMVRQGILAGKYADYFRQLATRFSSTTEEMVSFNELAGELSKAIDDLPDKTKLVFQLSRADGLTVKEISLRVDLSEKAVEYHISKAIKLLKASLKDYYLAIPAAAFLFL